MIFFTLLIYDNQEIYLELPTREARYSVKQVAVSAYS